jgi:hypothetical protein
MSRDRLGDQFEHERIVTPCAIAQFPCLLRASGCVIHWLAATQSRLKGIRIFSEIMQLPGK